MSTSSLSSLSELEATPQPTTSDGEQLEPPAPQTPDRAVTSDADSTPTHEQENTSSRSLDEDNEREHIFQQVRDQTEIARQHMVRRDNFKNPTPT
jgi:hypothetical protein